MLWLSIIQHLEIDLMKDPVTTNLMKILTSASTVVILMGGFIAQFVHNGHITRAGVDSEGDDAIHMCGMWKIN